MINILLLIIGIMLYVFIGSIIILIIYRKDPIRHESLEIAIGVFIWPVILTIIGIYCIMSSVYRFAKWFLTEVNVLDKE